MNAPGTSRPTLGAEAPPADRAFVARLASVRPEPAGDGAAPPPADLQLILATATTVPDHGDLTPWRFAVCTGAGRERFARALVAGLHEQRGDDVPDAVVAKMAAKPYAAPCQVMVVASPDRSSNVELWEQVASASCTGYAVVLAAAGLGYGAVWKSAAVLDAGPVRALFGLGQAEQLLGWVNIGSPAPVGRRKNGTGPVDLRDLVTVIGGEEGPAD